MVIPSEEIGKRNSIVMGVNENSLNELCINVIQFNAEEADKIAEVCMQLRARDDADRHNRHMRIRWNTV